MKDKTYDKLHKHYSTPGHTPFSSSSLIIRNAIACCCPSEKGYHDDAIDAMSMAFDSARYNVNTKKKSKRWLWQIFYWIAVIGLIYSIWEII